MTATVSAMTSELKPCPFCGGEAFATVHGRINGVGINDYSGNVMCYKCQASVTSEGFTPTPDQGIESATRKWNRRVNDAD